MKNHLSFRWIAPLYFLVEMPFNGARIKALDHLAPKPNTAWLMVGAGTVPEHQKLGRDVAWEWIEPCESMARKGKKRVNAVGIQNKWHALRWEEFSSDRLWDGIYFPFSLGVMASPEVCLDKAWQLLAPGGRLGILDVGLEAGALGIPRWIRPWFAYLVSRSDWSLEEWMNQPEREHPTFELLGRGIGLWHVEKRQQAEND